MTALEARTKSPNRSLVLAVLAVAAAAVACGTSYFEIPIETPIQPKLDVSAFQRVLIAGFIAGGSDEVDANQETVRLLRSQLRSKSSLRVIDADLLPLFEIAQDQNKTASESQEPEQTPEPEAVAASADRGSQPMPLPAEIKTEKDLEPYERLFANTAYWKQIGEEHQSPLIVTGTVLFSPHSRAGMVQREVEQYDPFGRRRVVPVRTYRSAKASCSAPSSSSSTGEPVPRCTPNSTARRCCTTPSRIRPRCPRTSSSWTASCRAFSPP